jgi:hypothetical protein
MIRLTIEQAQAAAQACVERRDLRACQCPGCHWRGEGPRAKCGRDADGEDRLCTPCRDTLAQARADFAAYTGIDA